LLFQRTQRTRRQAYKPNDTVPISLVSSVPVVSSVPPVVSSVPPVAVLATNSSLDEIRQSSHKTFTLDVDALISFFIDNNFMDLSLI